MRLTSMKLRDDVFISEDALPATAPGSAEGGKLMLVDVSRELSALELGFDAAELALKLIPTDQ